MSEDVVGPPRGLIRPPTLLGIWSLDSRQTLFLVWPLLAAAIGYAMLQYYYSSLAQDFFALWSYGRLLQDHPASDLYDPIRLHALQVGLGMDPTWDAPFPYPPIFLLVVWPLGLLPLDMAYRVWIGFGLAAFILAVTWPQIRPLTVVSLAVLPACTVCVAAGQSGLLTGALLIGGLRLATARPWLAGLLLGILTFKPQLGLMVPVALAAAGAWRSFGACVVVTAVLAVVTVLAFGAGAWVDWLTTLPGYQSRFDLRVGDLHKQPTVTANLVMAGVSAAVAQFVQAAVAAVMVVLVWMCCRRGLSRTAIAVVAAATVAANPHAFFYDLPMLTAAALFLGQSRVQAGDRLNWAETSLLLGVLWIPSVVLWAQFPVSLPVVLPFALWAGWQGLRAVEAWPGHAVANCNSASRA